MIYKYLTKTVQNKDSIKKKNQSNLTAKQYIIKGNEAQTLAHLKLGLQKRNYEMRFMRNYSMEKHKEIGQGREGGHVKSHGR